LVIRVQTRDNEPVDKALRRLRKLWLTVNKENAVSIAFYERIGFTTQEAMVTDIGEGFVMDDYRMVKVIG